jgi:hypothetical protein
MVMNPRQPNVPPDEETLNEVEKALDKALNETFPASDPVNLHQWTEKQSEEPKAGKPKEAAKAEEEDEPDRAARYLKGPTSFSA